jgi:hypothetical protein
VASTRRRGCAAGLPAALLLLLACFPASADSPPKVRVGGYAQLWYVNEQAENGKIQDYTGDPGADIASGFSMNRARLQVGMDWGPFGGSLQIRLEGGSPGLLDAYGAWRAAGDALVFRFGQMKIPSAWEVAVPDEELDFATRSRFASETANWSLSKSTFTTSPLYYVQSYLRDTGVGVDGDLLGLRYALMVGDGLGAGGNIGADESRGLLYANPFGAYFYAARVSYDLLTEVRRWVFPVPASLVIGGHVTWNNHPDCILSDAKTVVDLKRWSWSADAALKVWDRVRLTGMYGEGVVDDDYDHDGQVDYSYRGWEARVVAILVPDVMEAAARWETFSWSRAVTGGWAEADALTVGVTFSWKPVLRLQLNYKWKLQSGDLTADASSHLILISAQVKLAS